VLLDEIVEVIENLALTLRQWQHGPTIRKGKAKVNGRIPCLRLTFADQASLSW
jgi:hypothetical protein